MDAVNSFHGHGMIHILLMGRSIFPSCDTWFKHQATQEYRRRPDLITLRAVTNTYAEALKDNRRQVSHT